MIQVYSLPYSTESIHLNLPCTSTMDIYEKWGYTLLSIIAALYIVALFIGMIATFPFGLIGLLLIAGVGILLIKVMKERMKNKEDDYYSREIDQ